MNLVSVLIRLINSTQHNVDEKNLNGHLKKIDVVRKLVI